ncbi:hypothetical protein AJ80_05982 [Polytolypa hystricis UAMH7299]|uniref:Uncharacterized protein n=1 Tax=Polytolypa hystricis (strain UAMH7299) TaxID=1447883 RepID=A0A2B7XZN7_POLH7|nr:hypothetical protein AJ80_05982 [Polytolypa hystricis UAMH7299]
MWKLSLESLFEDVTGAGEDRIDFYAFDYQDPLQGYDLKRFRWVGDEKGKTEEGSGLEEVLEAADNVSLAWSDVKENNPECRLEEGQTAENAGNAESAEKAENTTGW